jgi:hypothetical protein
MLRDLAVLLCGALTLAFPLVMFFGWYGAKDSAKRRRLAKVAELRAEVVRARTLAAPVYTASAPVLTPEEIADQELEGTRQIRVDILGSWIPPEELDEDAPLYERVRRARPFVHQTAIGPGWVLVTKPENAEVVGAE